MLSFFQKFFSSKKGQPLKKEMPSLSLPQKLSIFLPDSFLSNHRIVVIAGKGIYPQLTIDQIRKLGISCGIIAFEEETSLELFYSFREEDRSMIKVGQLGHLLSSLKQLKADYAIMAGQITPKRLFHGLHPDLKAITILANLKEKNAESIFGAIANEMDKIHVPLLDARIFLDHELAEKGWMTKDCSLDKSALDHGIHIAKQIAAMDIGQGVVVNHGTVLAVEAFEGTDSMIQRAGSFNCKDAIFVKTVKPNQDYRFDVPVFGLKTLESLHNANISMVALESKNTLILEKIKVLEKAKDLKISIYGY